MRKTSFWTIFRSINLFIFLLATFLRCLAQDAGSNTTESTYKIVMSDGTIFVGKMEVKQLEFEGSYGRTPVKSSDITGLNGGYLTLSDGSKLKGAFVKDQVRVDTKLNKVVLPLSSIIVIAKQDLIGSDSSSTQPPTRAKKSEDQKSEPPQPPEASMSLEDKLNRILKQNGVEEPGLRLGCNHEGSTIKPGQELTIILLHEGFDKFDTSASTNIWSINGIEVARAIGLQSLTIKAPNKLGEQLSVGLTAVAITGGTKTANLQIESEGYMEKSVEIEYTMSDLDNYACKAKGKISVTPHMADGPSKEYDPADMIYEWDLGSSLKAKLLDIDSPSLDRVAGDRLYGNDRLDGYGKKSIAFIARPYLGRFSVIVTARTRDGKHQMRETVFVSYEKNGQRKKANSSVGENGRLMKQPPGATNSISIQTPPSPMPVGVQDDATTAREALDYAMLSQSVYDLGTSKYKAPNGWEAVGLPSLICLLNPKNASAANVLNGFKAAAFIKGKKLAVVYEGTTGWLLGRDWMTDYAAAMGFEPAQYADALDFAGKVIKEAGANYDVVFTGHSLGGGLATYAALHFGKPAYVFNAAPIGIALRSEIQNLNEKESLVKNIDMRGDPVSGLGGQIGSKLVLEVPAGVQAETELEKQAKKSLPFLRDLKVLGSSLAKTYDSLNEPHSIANVITALQTLSNK